MDQQKMYVMIISLMVVSSFCLGTSARTMPRARPATGPQAEENFMFLGDSHMEKDGSVRLTGGDTLTRVGGFFFKEAYKFRETYTHGSASFDSAFIFCVTSSALGTGDGLSFRLTPDPKSLNSHEVLDVKFDIGLNCVSLKVGGLFSAYSADAKQDRIILKDGLPVTVWLEYKNNMKTFTLWLNRSSDPLLVAAHLDLHQFYKEFMYVGFTVSDGRDSRPAYIIQYWRFGITEYSSDPPPTEPEEPDDKKKAASAPERAEPDENKYWKPVVVMLVLILCLLMGYALPQHLIYLLLLCLNYFQRLPVLKPTTSSTRVKSLRKMNTRMRTGHRMCYQCPNDSLRRRLSRREKI